VRKQIILNFLDEDGFVLTDDCGSYLIKTKYLKKNC
jgi:hypothetical protein